MYWICPECPGKTKNFMHNMKCRRCSETLKHKSLVAHHVEINHKLQLQSLLRLCMEAWRTLVHQQSRHAAVPAVAVDQSSGVVGVSATTLATSSGTPGRSSGVTDISAAIPVNDGDVAAAAMAP